MRQRSLFAVLVMMFLLFTISAGVLAQDIDIDSMSNEQLGDLLMLILQRLEQGEKSAETPDAPELTGTPAPAVDLLNIAEAVKYRIYQNKKLIIEQIPGYYFIQINTDEDEPKSPSDGGPKTPKENFYPTQTPGWEHDGIPEG